MDVAVCPASSWAACSDRADGAGILPPVRLWAPGLRWVAALARQVGAVPAPVDLAAAAGAPADLAAVAAAPAPVVAAASAAVAVAPVAAAADANSSPRILLKNNWNRDLFALKNRPRFLVLPQSQALPGYVLHAILKKGFF